MTIFQKKSKRRLGNLGERPSPLDGRHYVGSAQTHMLGTIDTYTRATRILGYIARNIFPIFPELSRPRTLRIHCISLPRSLAKKDAFIFSCQERTSSNL